MEFDRRGGGGGGQVDEIRGQERNFELDLKGNVRIDGRFDELRSYKGTNPNYP